jgi:uncharacterized membrane protein
MTFWIIAVLALIGQETISTSALFVFAYTQNYNILVLTIIFIAITIIQIFVFHSLGLKLQSKGVRNFITNLTTIYILKANQFIGRWGKRLFLVFLAAFLFPAFLTSIIASWLNLPFRTKLFCILLGDCIWYHITWSIVLGTSFLIENPEKLWVNVVIISFVFVIFQRRIANQIMAKWS